MASRGTVRFAYALALVFAIRATECGVAQGPPQAALPQTMPLHSITDELHAMSRLASVIFAGQVVAVRRIDGGNGATGVVEIQFAVEDAVRGGCGSIYTLREWAGLWPAGEEPFRVGQRFLMLLHAPSAAGLSSPVGGMDGAIPIRGIGHTQAPGPAETASARTVAAKTGSAGISASQADRVVDLRWLGTRVVQPMSYRTTPVVNPTAPLVSVDVIAVKADYAPTSQNTTGEASDDGTSVVPIDEAPASASQAAAYGTVLGMLRAWEMTDHATH